jgi:capsular polysaccharide biosynthesis protein
MEIRQLEERLGYSGKGNATKEGKNRKPEESRKSQMNQYYKRLMAPEIEDKFFLRGEILKSAKEISALKREIGENNSNVNKIQAKIKNAPIREQEMLNLTRDYENKKRLYDDIKKKKFDFDMSEAIEKQQEDARFQILDPANLPKTPFSPDVRRIIQIALMAAIALGFGGVFTLEALDTKIRGTKDFRHYSHLPVFATIPVIKEMKYSRVSTIKTLAIGGGMVLIIISISLLFVIFYAKTGKTLFSLGGIG